MAGQPAAQDLGSSGTGNKSWLFGLAVRQGLLAALVPALLLSFSSHAAPQTSAQVAGTLSEQAYSLPDKEKDKDKGKKPDAAAAAPAKDKDEVKSIEEVVKKCRRLPGLFALYQDTTNGNLYMQVNQAHLGKEYIYFVHTADAPLTAGTYRGSYRDTRIFKLGKHYNRIEFTSMNTGYYYDSTNALSKAAEANVSHALLHSGAIVGQNKDKTEWLIKADELFMSEVLHSIKPPQLPGMPPGLRFSLGGLSKDKTKYGSLRNYPMNTDVVVQYVFDNPNGFVGGEDIADPRSVTIALQHSIIEVPKNGFKPRKDDARVGYFGGQMEDMTSMSATPYRDYINRWHLVKKDPNAALSEPVEPIVWWMEKTTPKEWRPIIKKAGEAWNLAFEAAGFKNAVVVKEQPDTATWDAGDIRYNVLRWVSSPNPPFGGYGPSFTNPRTGQILGADIMLEYVFMTNKLVQSQTYETAGWQQYVGTQSEEHTAALKAMGQWAHKHQGMHACEAGLHLHHQMQTGASTLAMLDAKAEDMNRFIEEGLFYLILHEMGHTMGLMHNMKSSQLHGVPAVYDRATTEPMGLTGSVMEYPAANLPLDKSKPIQYFTTKPGPYDIWAITYGYSPALADEKAEAARLEKILSRSTEPALAFGNDADDMRAPGKAVDPRVNVGDLSADAITYGVNRMKLINSTLPKLKAKFLKPGGTYHELRDKFLRLTGERAIQCGVISRYVGGVYVDRSVVGQKANAVAYTPVAYADQKRAMAALNTYLFSPEVAKGEAEFYNLLAQQRRGFNFFGGPEVPNVTGRILAQQREVMAHLLNADVLDRLVNSELYGNTYKLTEMMGDLTTGVFAADAAVSVNVFRQNLQNEYVQALISIAGLNDKGNGRAYSYPAQAAALAQLTRIKTVLATPAPTADAATRAHRSALAFKINKAFKQN